MGDGHADLAQAPLPALAGDDVTARAAAAPRDHGVIARRNRGQNRAIGRGMSWTALGTAVAKTISIVSKLVLAWFLVPRDFGLVSMVIVFTQIVKGVSDLGLRPALIGRPRDGDTRLLFDAAFWVLLMIGVGIFAIMVLAGAPFMVWFYGDPALTPVAIAMCLVIPFQNAQLVPETILYRLQRFKAISLCEITGAVVGSSVAVAMAFAGIGVWSLVAQLLVGAGSTLVCFFLATPWRPRLRLSLGVLVQVREYSQFILGARLMVYVQQNADYLLLGKLRGASDLGVYAFAFLLTETLRSQVFWIVSRVVFPVYSRIMHDRQRIAEIYLGTIRYMTLTMWPLSVLLILFSEDALEFFFGTKWAGAGHPIQLLALASMVVASAGTSGEVFRAIGKPQIDFSINTRVTLFVALPGLWLGTTLLGPTGTAAAVVAYCLAGRLAAHVALSRELGITLRAVLVATMPAMAGTVAMLACKLLFGDAHWAIASVAAALAYVVAITPTLVPYYRSFRGKSAGGQRPVEPSVTVAFLGSDGAGKSSLIRVLGQRTSANCIYLGMSPDEKWQLSIARAAYANQAYRTGTISRALGGGLFWLLLFPIELILRRFAARDTGQGGALHLLDRVPGLPFIRRGILAQAYRYLLPRIDFVVLLTGDPEIISARKPQETTTERTRRETIKWATVARRICPNLIELDTTELSIEQCADLVESRLAHVRAA